MVCRKKAGASLWQGGLLSKSIGINEATNYQQESRLNKERGAGKAASCLEILIQEVLFDLSPLLVLGKLSKPKIS